MTSLDATSTAPLAHTLRRLYFTRFGFAVIWALLLALVSPASAIVLTVLLVLYPLVDAASALVELRASGSNARSRASELANVVVSVIAAIALGWASFVSVGAVLVVWGIWAVLAGASQLLTGLSRRSLGGQWPLIFSGGLSVLVGFTFVAQGVQGAASVTSVAGYATLGGVLFLVSAIRLGRAARKS
jgi:uncharacterized membrane protein HdeD (DUF308 family)